MMEITLGAVDPRIVCNGNGYVQNRDMASWILSLKERENIFGSIGLLA
jgi:hypothetical protein